MELQLQWLKCSVNKRSQQFNHLNLQCIRQVWIANQGASSWMNACTQPQSIGDTVCPASALPPQGPTLWLRLHSTAAAWLTWQPLTMIAEGLGKPSLSAHPTFSNQYWQEKATHQNPTMVHYYLYHPEPSKPCPAWTWPAPTSSKTHNSLLSPRQRPVFPLSPQRPFPPTADTQPSLLQTSPLPCSISLISPPLPVHGPPPPQRILAYPPAQTWPG